MKSSKKEERMLILNMVREGKITVDESIKLLEALNEGESEAFEGNYGYEMEDKVNSFTASLDNFAKDMNEKAKTTYKDFEPKLKNATKTVVEKTVGVLVDITNSLNESLQNMEKSEKCEDENCQCAPCDEEDCTCNPCDNVKTLFEEDEDKPEEN